MGTLPMPKNKSHKGLAKRIKITKTGKVRVKRPNSRHLKSNKNGTAIQSYRGNNYASSGNLKALAKMLFRGLRSEEQSKLDKAAALVEVAAA
ncbi:MAG: 50S ribosomal protein L35 [Phycisphaerales bacterium]|nr:50S ribosomal protein L35 [Phycisphaerales bacterium]